MRGKSNVLEVDYGEYPQSVLRENESLVLERLYNSNSLKVTGKRYTTDSVKYNDYDKTFQKREHIEYEYNGKKYIRFVADANADGETLSDGRTVQLGSVYWVCVEPITWLIDEEKNIALCKKIIFSGVQFKNQCDYTGNFNTTDIKQFMNNCFAKEIGASSISLENTIEEIQQENKKNEQNQTKQQEKERQMNKDVGHDTHSMWKQAVDKKNRQIEQIQTFGKQQIEEGQRKKNEKIGQLTNMGEKEAFKQNKIEKKKQLEELRQSLASQSYGHGNDTNSGVRNISNIGISSPLIDWRRLLKEAVKFDMDWSYRNAEIEEGVVTAYLEEMPRPETEIVLDTSGSINEVLLRNFLRECKNILQSSKIKVGCFDTKFYGFNEIRNEADIDNMGFVGGGGTNFNAAVNAFTKRVENKIIFTDGDAPMPNVSMNILWIVFGECTINPKGGRVIYINQEQLEKLGKSNGKTR